MICVALLSVKKSDLSIVHASPAAAAKISRLNDKSVRRTSETELLLLRDGIDMQGSRNRTLPKYATLCQMLILLRSCCVGLATDIPLLWNTGRSAADAEVASPCSHLANPELQKLIDGNRASAGRNKIKQHQCVHHFRLVKPIVDTIRSVNRFVARNHRWRVRQEGYRTNDQKAKGGQRCEKSDRDAQAAKEFNSRNKPLQYANVWDAKDPERLYECLMSFLVRELMNSG
jgi:hypothetical protein